jgi:hypothetical protein
MLDSRPLLVLQLIHTLIISVKGGCPAGYECNPFNTVLNKQKCPKDSYSLHGWSRCCPMSSAWACGEQYPGHYALNSDCQCAPVACHTTGIQNKELMRGDEGQIVCDVPPTNCKNNLPCPVASMMRETHTCNCLRISSPCMKNEALWGNLGGPYICIPFS